MRSERRNLTCTSCGKEFSARVITQVDRSRPEDLEANLGDGSLFTFRCPHCGEEMLFNHYLLWVDENRTVAVCNITSDEEIRAIDEALSALSAFGKSSDISRRYVNSPSRLCEKTEIFTAGLDDRAVEIVKLYFVEEIRRSHPKKTINDALFFRNDEGYGFLFSCPDGDLSVNISKEAFGEAAAKFDLSAPAPQVVDAAWAINFLTGRRG